MLKWKHFFLYTESFVGSGSSECLFYLKVATSLFGGRAKGRNGELAGLPWWELVLTGAWKAYSTEVLTCVSTGWGFKRGS